MYSRSPLFKATCIIGALLLLLSGAEVWYQIRVNNLKSVVDRVGQSIIKPMGGVEEDSGIDGEHVWNICVDNGPCPRVSTMWLISIDKDSGKELLQQVLQQLQKNGFTTNTSEFGIQGGGAKGKEGVNFMVTPYRPTGDLNPPYSLSNDKEWVYISVSSYE